tara:strand:- start:2659 stop:3384 length:726 start_codon:yes stop_codon:yes gene_type:complete
MNILVVSDIHYSLKQFDWLVKSAPDFDLIVIAGDLMELASSVEPDTQAVVVEQYFRRICNQTPLVVCSGNHDLIEEYDGTRSPEWLEDLSMTNLTVDHGLYEDETIKILSLPWWETDAERKRIASWLNEQQQQQSGKPVFWVHHAPPHGAKTSWNGKRDLGDKTLVEWIAKYTPTLVLSGHVHNAPYYPDGSWIDRIGETYVINGGRQTGDKPATVEIEVEEGHLVWCGMEGCEEASLIQA